MDGPARRKSKAGWPLGLALLTGVAGAAPLKVVGTFSIVSDMVQNVGGSRVQVTNLVPVGGDTHTYAPATGDIKKVAQAQLIFQNGAGLENWFGKLRPATQAPLVTLSEGLQQGSLVEGGQTVPDPHLWWDPHNAAAYAGKIRDALSKLDPAGRTYYAERTSKYVEQISQLDRYAQKRVAELPAARRQLVTNHDALGYFARRYGFTVVGEVIPGLGTEQEPSARDSARLIQAIRKQNVRAIFTENTVNPRLAQTISQETGVRVAPPLYTDALGAPGSAGATYLKAFKANVDAIVGALR